MTAGLSHQDLSRRVSSVSWILGAALLAAVIAASLRFAEARAFVDLLERRSSSWLPRIRGSWARDGCSAARSRST
jgi:hypothetical protein